MTDEKDPQGELPIEDPPAAQEPAPEPEPVAPAAGVDVDVLADRVIEKLMSAAQTAAPEAQTQTYTQGSPMEAAIQELQRRASDPSHPLYADALIHLDNLRSRGQEEEWAQLGCPPGHPARALFAQSPLAFSNRPRHAFTEWQLQEARKGQAANNDAARAKAAEDKEREAARKVRDAAPDMPSRNVQPTPRAGKDSYDTLDDFRRAAAADPTLDDRYDRGEITIRNY